MSDWRGAILLELAGILVLSAGCGVQPSGESDSATSIAGGSYLAPVDVQLFDGGSQVGVLGSQGRRLVVVDGATGQRDGEIQLPAAASGMVIDEGTTYVTTLEPAGRVLALNVRTGAIEGPWRVGHTPMAPVISADGRMLCVANRFDHTVSLIDLGTDAIRTVRVVRSRWRWR